MSNLIIFIIIQLQINKNNIQTQNNSLITSYFVEGCSI